GKSGVGGGHFLLCLHAKYAETKSCYEKSVPWGAAGEAMSSRQEARHYTFSNTRYGTPKTEKMTRNTLACLHRTVAVTVFAVFSEEVLLNCCNSRNITRSEVWGSARSGKS